MVAIRLGDHQAGLRLLQAAVNQLRDAGYALYHTASLVELADAHARTGQVAAALTAINEALAQSTRNDERWCMAELLRVKAELQLLQATPETDRLAEDCLQQSLDWARRCGSLSWELRAATSLCRLRLNQNRAAEGRALLTSVYMRFAEGFETADLTTARRLFAN